MVDSQYRRIVADIRQSVGEGRSLAGAVRFFWSDLAPMVNSRYVTIRQMSRDASVNEKALNQAIYRIRREQRAQSEPASQPYGATATPARAAAGVSGRGDQRETNISDEAADLEKMIADGYQPLNDGSGKYWKRYKGLFKVKRPGVKNPRIQDEDPRKPTN